MDKMSFIPRGAVVRLLFGLALGLALSLLAVGGLTALAAQQDTGGGPANGVVIVQFGDRELTARPISFTAPISGLKALQLTGLNVVTSGSGSDALVCSIEGVGCPASDCFCDPNRWWGYNYWDGATWNGYMVGAGNSAIGDGAVEGWRWGSFGDQLNPAVPVTAALSGLAWLHTQQSLTNGSIGGTYGSLEASYALAANNERAADWRATPDSPSLQGYLTGAGPSYSRTAEGGSAGRLAVALAGVDACWPAGAKTPLDYYNAGTGTFAGATLMHSWGILGTAALSQSIPGPAVDFLKAQQQANGGWEWAANFGTDTNTTALAVQALIAAGESVTSTAVVDGLAFIRSTQNPDGGFPYDPMSPWPGGQDSDTNSTANVVQAIRVVGQDPMSAEWTAITGTHPISFLLGMQLPSGAFKWQTSDTGPNLAATTQAISALLYRPTPFRSAVLPACPAALLPSVTR